MYSCFMKARDSLVVWCRKKKQKTGDGENVFFKGLAKFFLLTSKVVYDRPSIKWTSWKGNDTLYYYVILLKVY